MVTKQIITLDKCKWTAIVAELTVIWIINTLVDYSHTADVILPSKYFGIMMPNL